MILSRPAWWVADPSTWVSFMESIRLEPAPYGDTGEKAEDDLNRVKTRHIIRRRRFKQSAIIRRVLTD